MSDPDAVVVGSGPNGLAAACRMAQRGLRVLVLEANPRRPGGALGSVEATLPGFVHDVGAAFFPFASTSPAFRELGLERYGLEWLHAEIESCHPALDGSVAYISRKADAQAAGFGSGRDGETFRRLAEWHAVAEQHLLPALLLPFPTVRPLLALGLAGLWRVSRIFMSSGRGLSERLFQGEAAQRVLPALSMHTDVAPSDRFGAGLGYLLGLSAATAGFPVPRGGARAITNALVTLLEAHGGRLRLGAQVDSIVVKAGRAVAVRLADGEEIAARQAVLADTGAPALYLRLLDADHVPGRVIKKMKGFTRGWGTLKVDWALSGPVPWEAEPARRSAVVHTGENLDDLDRFAAEIRAGKLPERPYLVIGQQSLVDDSRAPRNQHTLYAYSRVPSRADWSDDKNAFADRIEQRIEALAPGFVPKILGRSVSSPADLQADNENLVGGDIAGGSGAWNHQLVFRPVFPYFRYRTPVARLYLCSSYAHPGAGVHGMCGYNAAAMALRDIG